MLGVLSRSLIGRKSKNISCFCPFIPVLPPISSRSYASSSHFNRLVSRARICKRLGSRNRFLIIDFMKSIPRASTSNRLVVPARQAGNRFLGSLKGLQIRAQSCPPPPHTRKLCMVQRGCESRPL